MYIPVTSEYVACFLIENTVLNKLWRDPLCWSYAFCTHLVESRVIFYEEDSRL